jgi:hypothetical protein
MRGFLLLLIAVAVVAIAICGPPALAAGNTDYQIMQTAAVTAENPATSPALLPVVADPGSCCALSATVVVNRLQIVPITRRAADFQRWRCRLLLRSAACGC